jgi:hypothetical protein
MSTAYSGALINLRDLTLYVTYGAELTNNQAWKDDSQKFVCRLIYFPDGRQLSDRFWDAF